MIYCEIVSGMSDQMFIYAFARTLQQKYKRQQNSKIAFDHRNYAYSPDEWKYNILEYKCSDNIVFEERKLSIIQRLVLKIYYKYINGPWGGQYEVKHRDFLSLFGVYICTFNYHEFKNKPLPFIKNYLLLGFFQSPKFFKDIDEELKGEFKLKSEDYSTYIKDLLKDVETSNSVCMHIRRGDFESDGLKNNLSVCHEDYYDKAIKIIKEKIDNPKLFISTNDMEWVKTLKLDIDYEIIDFNKVSAAQNQYIMSRCKNFIIANSGYSWWAQHLSENKDKIVISPNKMANNTPYNFMGKFEDGWVLVEV